MPDMPAKAPGNDVSSLKLSGEVDIAAVARVLAEANKSLSTRSAVLEIDLGEVTFIDSSGLGALVRIRNQAGLLGTRVVLVSPSRASRRLLELSRLDQVFEISPQEESRG